MQPGSDTMTNEAKGIVLALVKAIDNFHAALFSSNPRVGTLARAELNRCQENVRHLVSDYAPPTES